METARAPVPFVTTRWTLVLRSAGSSPEARAALAELCEAYWAPVLAHVRRVEREEERARDLTQGFFERVLAGTGFGGASPGRGPFRAYLLGAVNHHLADARDAERAQKRGGGQEMVSLDAIDAGSEVEPRVTGTAPGCAAFDRDWAVSLVNRAVAALAVEQRAADRAAAWEALKPWLLGDAPAGSQRGIAEQLGWTENAVRVAVHRLRRRFRELVRQEIAQTVEDDAAVRDEMRYLIEVLSAPAPGAAGPAV